jgi:hypothetical protein
LTETRAARAERRQERGQCRRSKEPFHRLQPPPRPALERDRLRLLDGYRRGRPCRTEAGPDPPAPPCRTTMRQLCGRGKRRSARKKARGLKSPGLKCVTGFHGPPCRDGFDVAPGTAGPTLSRSWRRAWPPS